MKKVYDILFSKLGKWILPKYLRTKANCGAFVNICISYFNIVYQDLLRFRKQKLYELSITPQKPYLEMLLNDKYDFTLRRIYIEDGIDKPAPYIYQRAEVKPMYIRKRSEAMPKTIYTRGESGDLKDDFVVFVPMDVVFEFEEMGSLIKIYKLAGVKFKIQRF